MPNRTEGPTNAALFAVRCGSRASSLGAARREVRSVGHSRSAASSKAGAGHGDPRQNERVMSPRVRERIRQIAGLWLAWTVAGLFYITQDSVPRLYRGEAVPWRYVFVGWMTGMYICAALTPALLWLGGRWPLERRVTHAGLHLCFSVVFSIVVHRHRSAAADGARRLSIRVAASVRCRRHQSDAVVRHSGGRHPVLGGHRAPGRVPVAGERQDSVSGRHSS